MTMTKKNILGAVVGTAALVAGSSCSDSKADEAMPAAGANAAIENIMTRTSVRKFDGRAISRDTLETIVKAGMAAPTAMNKHPWAFVVVDEREVLDSLGSVHPYSNLATAAAAIIVCGDMKNTIEADGRDFWIQDCSAASENILLAAHALGIGAVWCGVYPIADRISPVSRVLGLPGDVIPLNIIAMGYPAADAQPKDKWKPQNVHYNRW